MTIDTNPNHYKAVPRRSASSNYSYLKMNQGLRINGVIIVFVVLLSSTVTVRSFVFSDARKHTSVYIDTSLSGVASWKRDTGSSGTKSGRGVKELLASTSEPNLKSAPSVSYEWEIFVDQSKSSLEKGGSATLDACLGLAPDFVKIIPAILPKSKAKGPLVRCISVDRTSKRTSFDVANVDSVDKVYRILDKHMRVKGLNLDACDCLKWKYKGNGYLEQQKTDLAIDAYSRALETGVQGQEGIIRLMRATAYLQRAASHKAKLKETVKELIATVPSASVLQDLYAETRGTPSYTNAVFRKVLEDTHSQDLQFRKTQYWHGLYQYALLQAAQDSFRATKLLPNYPTTWLRTGEILSELWKVRESTRYYEKAIKLDPTLQESILPVIDRLNKRQDLLESARTYGWSEDTLRLALDVAR